MRSLLYTLAKRHASRCSSVQSATTTRSRTYEGARLRATIVRRSSTSSSSSSREYPPFPRVGVAAVLFKPPRGQDAEPSVLLIRRAKPPNQGSWSFPGGALELGEGVVAGAERELSEEVPGLRFDRRSSVAGGLAGGVAFAAADSIHYDGGGGEDDGGAREREGAGGTGRASRGVPPRYHWAIIEVAAIAATSSPGPDPASPSPFDADAPPPGTADDATAARWVSALSELRCLEESGEATPGCARVAEEAVERFAADLGMSKG